MGGGEVSYLEFHRGCFRYQMVFSSSEKEREEKLMIFPERVVPTTICLKHYFIMILRIDKGSPARSTVH